MELDKRISITVSKGVYCSADLFVSKVRRLTVQLCVHAIKHNFSSLHPDHESPLYNVFQN